MERLEINWIKKKYKKSTFGLFFFLIVLRKVKKYLKISCPTNIYRLLFLNKINLSVQLYTPSRPPVPSRPLTHIYIPLFRLNFCIDIFITSIKYWPLQLEICFLLLSCKAYKKNEGTFPFDLIIDIRFQMFFSKTPHRAKQINKLTMATLNHTFST